MAQGTKGPAAPPAPLNGTSHPPAPGGGNRKKQKRREKAAAKQAAEAEKHGVAPAKNGHLHAHGSAAASQQAPQYARAALDALDDPSQYDEEIDDYSDEEYRYEQAYAANGHGPTGYSETGILPPGGKKTKKKKRGSSSVQHSAYHPPAIPHHAPMHPSAQSHSAGKSNLSKDRIWNTSTSEERERIREFWLSLGEDERKSLVKIEKEAVLKKMKEQQKHSCSCSVCGRKRTAIEEELEVLYDAYYEELEQYANLQHDGAPILPPVSYAHHSHRPGMIARHHPRDTHYDDTDDLSQGEDDEGDPDYSGSEISSEEDYSSEEPLSLPPPETDFLQFGSSLQVKGGILTVADDLLKNDGKKFIEMMEQLAERRMQREEEAQYQSHGSAMYGRSHGAHSHAPPPEEDEEYDDEDYDDGDEEYEEEEDEEEDDTMTEEQRMEEGRRMFQIFAARMFEQRVLQAYREKVAAERQAKLLEELEAEENMKDQREAKRAKEAQKKKEKKEKQKQQKAEEKARKDAEQAAKEAEAKAAEEKRLEEQRKKKEDARRKKEAERKAQEEDRQRKEGEKLKRQQEERERQAEIERKQREMKAQEKKAKEEAKRQEREQREAKEKVAREKKAQQEKERKERESTAKAEKDRVRKEEQAAAAAQNPASTSKKSSQPVAIPPGLLKQTSSTGVPSPHVTPAIPKAPTPSRPRQASQQGSHGSSPKASHVTPGTSKSMSPSSQVQNPIVPKSILQKPQPSQQPTSVPHAQLSSPMPPIGPPPGMHGHPGMNMPNMPPGLNGFPRNQGPIMPGMGGPRPVMAPGMPMFPQHGTQTFHGFQPQPPGVHSPNPMPFGRGHVLDGPPPGFGGMPPFGGPNPIPGFGMGMPTHSRQASGSFEKPNVDSPIAAPQAQPIQRPAPIQRPSSVKPHEENQRPVGSDVDELANHLGSKALLDDADDVAEFPQAEPRRTSLQTPMGSLRGAPLGFPGFSDFSDAPGQPRMESYAPFGTSSSAGNMWSTPPMPFPMAGSAGWGNSPTTGFFNNTPSNPLAIPRPGEHRIVWIRRVVCDACKQLAARQATTPEGFADANEVLLTANKISKEPTISIQEIRDACDIFGDPANGGGDFKYEDSDANSGRLGLIKFIEGAGHTATLGEIGSPVPGHSVPAVGGFGGRHFPGLGASGF